MPYIKQVDRPTMDVVVKAMEDAGVKANGDLNYILYAFCVRNVEPGYGNYKKYRNELRECADEIGRRLLASYEDEKIEINGDVF